MRCPTLAELPPPPVGREGWPWTEDIPSLPSTRPDGTPWPRISIVTPSYNQGPYIEETIRSLLLQGYPNLEYIIMDGGSSDGTLEVIRKYSDWIDDWRSERDDGQADAINKGFAISAGDLVQWINSDDVLLPGTLGAIGAVFDGVSTIAGGVIDFGIGTENIRLNQNLTMQALLGAKHHFYHQPGVWLVGKHCRELDPIPIKYHYALDWIYMISYLERNPSMIYLNRPLVKYRLHPVSKTVALQSRFAPERERWLRTACLSSKSELIRNGARWRIRQIDWWNEVDRISRDGTKSRLLRAAKICGAALLRPRSRLNRWTLGAVLRTALESTKKMHAIANAEADNTTLGGPDCT